MKQMDRQSWLQYYQQKQGQPPSKLLVKAVEYVAQKQQALDLGAGPLLDAQFLLQAGFERVTAVDAEPTVRQLAEQQQMPTDKLMVVISPIEELVLPANTYDLVTTHLTLSFLSLSALTALIPNIHAGLTPGGIFCGDIWGPDDEWNDGSTALTFLTEQQVRDLLSDFETVLFETTNSSVTLARGGSKQSHVHHFIVRKAL